MKTALILAVLIGGTSLAIAQTYYGHHGGFGSPIYGIGSNPQSHYVHSYIRSDGTFVHGYHATNPNGTRLDNYSTSGNRNPFTGAYGTRNPYSQH